MAKTTPMTAGERDRPYWLPWSAFPFQIRFAQIAGARVHYTDEGSGPALLLVSAGQWSFMLRGPIGFLVAAGRPGRFRALVISNSFGWPLADYPAVRRTLKVIASPPFSGINTVTNVAALLTASRYGVGRRMSKADRRSFLGPWRSRNSRRATRQILARVLRIDPMMAAVEWSLRTTLAGLPVLTLFGRVRKPLTPIFTKRIGPWSVSRTGSGGSGLPTRAR